MIGFHSTSLAASNRIEEQGFLPHKIFAPAEHSKLVQIANTHGLKTFKYESWLTMYSVTFTKDPIHAMKHVEDGKAAGGQGLGNIVNTLKMLPAEITPADREFVSELESKIKAIQADQAVTYVVDLTGLGQRLDHDEQQPFMYFRWDPTKDLPKVSEIEPARILMKLMHAHG